MAKTKNFPSNIFRNNERKKDKSEEHVTTLKVIAPIKTLRNDIKEIKIVYIPS